jgi:HEAT repeat protein
VNAELSWDAAIRLLEELPALPSGERGAAVEILVRNSSPGVRERALQLGARLLSDQRISEHIHDDHDAVLRNAGLEMLKLRGAASFALAVRLLADPEPDVVLQAILILDHLRDPRALAPLRALLRSADLNLVYAAILAIGRLGDARSRRDLVPFLHADPWLKMAAVQGLGDLRSARAIPDLRRLFGDPVIGSLAVEAVARIGGRGACRALAAHWLSAAAPRDSEALLSLLALVLAGLPRRPAGDELLASLALRLVPCLADPAPRVRGAAARCLLALGPSAGDLPALAVLAQNAQNPQNALSARASAQGAQHPSTAQSAEPTPSGESEAASLPACLRRRPDLMAALLRQPGAPRAWGFCLAALFPRQLPLTDFLSALGEAGQGSEALAAAVHCLRRIPPGVAAPAFGIAVLDLFLSLPAELRAELGPALRRHREAIRAALATRGEIGLAERVVLAAQLGATARAVASQLAQLPLFCRQAAITQLAGNRTVMRILPWETWLQEAPETYATLAAEVAVASRLAELLPLLRSLPPRLAGPVSLRAFAELQDRAAVPLLLEVLRVRPDLRLPTLESLGRIGGKDARMALTAAARQGAPAESRLAYRALSLCATLEEAPLFRGLVTHSDWYVRLACAEALGRFSGAENLAGLARLAGDPVAAVAHRALFALGE